MSCSAALTTLCARSLAHESNSNTLVEEVKDYGWDVILLSEVRRTGETFIKVFDGQNLITEKSVDLNPQD